ncbi:MAG: GDSL-type esterase/lipase family protein [Oscillospiraceae bacterium]|nr:GDSL-type esterase/lipase family protein [Oscillospiraceae bacterium]
MTKKPRKPALTCAALAAVLLLTYLVAPIFGSFGQPQIKVEQSMAANAAVNQSGGGLVVLGDSIASGYGLNEKSQSYGFLLADAMQMDNNYCNLAYNGATSHDLLNVLAQPENAGTVGGASIVLISIGGNDIIHPAMSILKEQFSLPADSTGEQICDYFKNNLSQLEALENIVSNPVLQLKMFNAMADFAKNFKEITTTVRQINPTAEICVQTIYNPFSGAGELDGLSPMVDIIMGSMNHIIKKEAENSGFYVADIFTEFSGKAKLYTNIQSFDIHPNALGHTTIFDDVYEVITGSQYFPQKINNKVIDNF